MPEIYGPGRRRMQGSSQVPRFIQAAPESAGTVLLLTWSLKMIRSYLRGLTRRNVARALLGVTGTLLSGCGGLGPASKTPPPDPQLNQSINHIIFLVQENRGFDH